MLRFADRDAARQSVPAFIQRVLRQAGVTNPSYNYKAWPVSFSARSFNAALRESFTRPLSSMPMHLTQIMSPTLTTSSVRFTRKSASSEMCTKPVLARENFDKRTEFLRRDHATLIGLTDLDFACHATDDFLRARHALASRRVDVHRAVVLDVNFGAGFGDDALNGFAAGTDERADLLRIDLDCLDPRRVFRQLRPRFVQRATP